MINIGDMVKHRYNTSEQQEKVIGIVVDISKAAWDEQLIICHVDWLNSHILKGVNGTYIVTGGAKGYRLDDLERA
jgi:hypothetical protein